MKMMILGRLLVKGAIQFIAYDGLMRAIPGGPVNQLITTITVGSNVRKLNTIHPLCGKMSDLALKAWMLRQTGMRLAKMIIPVSGAVEIGVVALTTGIVAWDAMTDTNIFSIREKSE
jgi:hypothetical protein